MLAGKTLLGRSLYCAISVFTSNKYKLIMCDADDMIVMELIILRMHQRLNSSEDRMKLYHLNSIYGYNIDIEILTVSTLLGRSYFIHIKLLFPSPHHKLHQRSLFVLIVPFHVGLNFLL